jgi:Pyruvate/2-oxoacid:ferredoxin oxidoreductase delta subunit
MILRNIIEINEAKCDGCGLCVPACEEGAIRVINGKARVVSETYCDGLGACLGHCPRGAISMMQRVAAPFDHAAVAQHLNATQPVAAPAPARPACPGAMSMQLQVLSSAPTTPCAGSANPPAAAHHANTSQLANWPVQLHLLSPLAPYLRGADLLLVADCVPFACADFHSRILDGRPVAIGCPKLDDGQAYVQKLSQIIHIAQVHSVTVVHMEVPCCTGLLRIAEAAVQQAASDIPVRSVMVTVRGQIVVPSLIGIA